MTKQLTTTSLTPLELARQTANRIAAAHTIADYLSRKSDNTIRSQAAALAVFAHYLQAAAAGLGHEIAIFAANVASFPKTKREPDPEAWRGVTWGIVEGFVQWMLGRGYAIGSVNNRLSVIKTYCKLAGKAGVIDPRDMMLIKVVSGYSAKEGKRVDERRDRSRVGAKKAEHVAITPQQAEILKYEHSDSPGGRRDALLMRLLLDHGLRLGEVAALKVRDFDLDAGKMTFYRSKVDRVQTHKLTADTLRAARAYLAIRPAHDALYGRLLLGSRKGGELTSQPMSKRAITKRVKYLGEMLAGVDGLSAHDCRHYWATDAAINKTDAFSLRDAGGWSSLAMPGRYVAAAAVANEGVRLSI